MTCKDQRIAKARAENRQKQGVGHEGAIQAYLDRN